MKKIVSVIVLVCILLSFASCAAKNKTADFVIENTDETVLYEFSTDIADGDTVGSALERYFSENGIPYEEDRRKYLISIDGIEQADDWSFYWAYYYNGDAGMVTLWEQKLSDGDKVLLRYEAYNP